MNTWCSWSLLGINIDNFSPKRHQNTKKTPRLDGHKHTVDKI